MGFCAQLGLLLFVSVAFIGMYFFIRATTIAGYRAGGRGAGKGVVRGGGAVPGVAQQVPTYYVPPDEADDDGLPQELVEATRRHHSPNFNHQP